MARRGLLSTTRSHSSLSGSKPGHGMLDRGSPVCADADIGVALSVFCCMSQKSRLGLLGMIKAMACRSGLPWLHSQQAPRLSQNFVFVEHRDRSSGLPRTPFSLLSGRSISQLALGQSKYHRGRPSATHLACLLFFLHAIATFQHKQILPRARSSSRRSK